MFVLLHTPCSHEGYIPSSYVKRVSKQLHKAAQHDPSRHQLEAVAVFNYSPRTEDINGLPLTKGERVTVLDTFENNWLFARNQLG